jgi:hypothetical protein
MASISWGVGDRLFPVRSAPDRYFYAGLLPSGRQALVGRSVHGYILVALFGPDGELIEVVRRDLPSPPAEPGPGRIREVDEDRFEEYLGREFGFTPGLIRVKEFRLPAEMFGVYPLPDYFREFLTDPSSPAYDEEDRQALPEVIERWVKDGQFVLEWGNDFWLNSQGEVVAS